MAGGEFKIEVPIEMQGATGGSGGNKDLVGAVKKLDKTMFMNIDVIEMISGLMGDIFKVLQPLIKILSLLLFMIFLPAIPVVAQLTKWLAKLVGVMPKVWNFIIEGLTSFVEDIISIGKWIWKVLKNIGEMFFNAGVKIGEAAVAIGTAIADGIKWVWEAVITSLEFIANIGIWIWQQFVNGLKAVLNFGTWIWDLIKLGLESVGNLGTKIWEWIKNGLSFIFSGFKKIVNNIIDIVNKVPFVNIRHVSDAVISPGGQVISTAPDDYLIATKNPQSLGGGNSNITINVTGNKFNDENDMRKMVNMISKKLQQQSNRSFSR